MAVRILRLAESGIRDPVKLRTLAKIGAVALGDGHEQRPTAPVSAAGRREVGAF
jgi:hypothetical protein